MNNLRIYIVVSFLLFTTLCHSQNQNNVWYFGDKAGLNFNTTPPTVLIDGVFSHVEGVSSICDANGDLLFFTNGINVWNYNKEQMPNGFGLGGNNSSSQILVLPKPGDCNIFYIFTTPSQNFEGAALFSIVDMRLDFGKGNVVNKNTFLFAPTTERIHATFQNNGTDYWVLLQELGSNKFLSFSLSSTGIDLNPIVSNAGIANAQVNDAVGSMKFSTNGNKLCTANELGFEKCQLFDFDTQTGIVSNGFVVSDSAAYGVEFSKDDSKLYLSSFRKFKLSQYDLSSNNPTIIKNSEFILANLNTTIENGGALQIGSDSKIYVARNNKTYVGIIQNPNFLGASCGFINIGINLNGKLCLTGLPNLIKRYPSAFCGNLRASFTQSNLCSGNDITIIVSATYGTPGYQYSLDGINFQNSNVFTNLIAKDYEITVKDANSVIRKTIVKIPPANIFSLAISNVTQPDCGFSNGKVTLTTTNGIAPFQFSKDGINFQSSNTFTNLPASPINFIVRDVNGCTTNKQLNLVATNRFKIFAGNDTGIFINQTIPLFAKDLTNSNFITFKWSPSEGLDNPFIQNPIATITKNIHYTIEATTALGCIVRDSIYIEVYKEIGIFVPTAFTPNNDYRNDFLKAIPRGMKYLKYFKIYNRYGEIIFSTNDFSIGWDGKIRGISQNTSTYVWFAEGIDINGNIVERKGSFSLIR